MIIRDNTNFSSICPSAVRVGVHGEYEYRCTSTMNRLYAEDAGNGGADKKCCCTEPGFVASDSARLEELDLSRIVKNMITPERPGFL